MLVFFSSVIFRETLNTFLQDYLFLYACIHEYAWRVIQNSIHLIVVIDYLNGGIWSICLFFFFLYFNSLMGGGGMAIQENTGGYFYNHGVRENFLSMAQNVQLVKAMINTSDYKHCPVFYK